VLPNPQAPDYVFKQDNGGVTHHYNNPSISVNGVKQDPKTQKVVKIGGNSFRDIYDTVNNYN
jgi:hypothetical protein